jgi:hypothetical protein
MLGNWIARDRRRRGEQRPEQNRKTRLVCDAVAMDRREPTAAIV